MPNASEIGTGFLALISGKRVMGITLRTENVHTKYSRSSDLLYLVHTLEIHLKSFH